MLLHAHLPNNVFADIQQFGVNSTNAATGWSLWTKRKGVSMIQMICVGGGGSGGNSVVGAAGAAGGGGGGGGANVSILLIPAILVPDTLYVSVGQGGLPVIAGTASYIAIRPSMATSGAPLAEQCFLAANGGAAGGSASGGTAGTAGGQPTANTATSCSLSNLGQAFFYRGLAGSVGGTSTGTATAGGALTYATGLGLTVGGTGGGGLHQTSGNTGLDGGAASILSTSLYRGTSAATGGRVTKLAEDGSNGYQTVPGLFNNTPATGGGAGYNVTGIYSGGGDGGRGMPGCGGGGGGGSFTGSPSGSASGGCGGEGFVIITAW